ncbi:shikimate kinase [Fimbriiglobus ruber]|uniref:Shikimate kinase n=1 Tax=Fimbriiglobus ruber TaxID=1908690 RepID=A0A225DUT0_9BACT|nr:shikimate kinase [Fimbriiglobus ruber]OWK43404.1 Shikimate kinase I [Fimbriiglobus ruber]
MNDVLGRTPRVLLIGYRGTGKSTVGRFLGSELGWDFFDADDTIEAAAGRTVAEIFAAEGEAGFRAREAAALEHLCAGRPRVIATGGGAILRPTNRAALRAAGYVAWLTAPPDVVWERLQSDPSTAARRPNLTTGGFAEVANLMAAREPLYRETAHAAFDAGVESPEAIAGRILAAWSEWDVGRQPG